MKINRILLVFSLFLMISCSNSEQDELVKIQTQFGEMLVVLHDDTPAHKKNFLSIAKSGQYDSTFFHRVMNEFMIQGGDTSGLKSGESVGTIPAEITSSHFHEKGALAAARKPDQVNPKKESSSCQFYIVHGKKLNPAALTELENRANFNKVAKCIQQALTSNEHPDLNQLFDSLRELRNPPLINQAVLELKDRMVELYGPINDLKFTEKQKEVYSNIGGAPHLDGEYTIFGKVLSGLHIVDSIANQPVDRFSKPTEDIFMNMSVIKMSKSEVTKKYGYTYPSVKGKE